MAGNKERKLIGLKYNDDLLISGMRNDKTFCKERKSTIHVIYKKPSEI